MSEPVRINVDLPAARIEQAIADNEMVVLMFMPEALTDLLAVSRRPRMKEVEPARGVDPLKASTPQLAAALRLLADEATFSDVGLCDEETVGAGRLLLAVARKLDESVPPPCGICATKPPLVHAHHEARPGVACGGSGLTPEDSYHNGKVRAHNERAEGEPAPLWEWVRAALESPIAPHGKVIGVPGELGEIRLCLYRCFVEIHEDSTLPAICSATVRPLASANVTYCSTPAELRAALDKLAAEVSHG